MTQSLSFVYKGIVLAWGCSWYIISSSILVYTLDLGCYVKLLCATAGLLPALELTMCGSSIRRLKVEEPLEMIYGSIVTETGIREREILTAFLFTPSRVLDLL